MPLRRRVIIAITLLLIAAFSPGQRAQGPPPRTTLPIVAPPVEGTFSRDVETSTLRPSARVGAPAGAPNVLVVLLDDAGYAQTSTFGAPVPTPTLDALAKDGLRFTRFHVAAMCSPTRAALMTGRNPHAVGMGTITNWSNGYPGYTGSIPKSAAFMSEVLRANGYATASIGKWHLIPDPEMTLAGPFDHWPTHQGFDYFYGFINAETDQWNPELTEGTSPVRMTPPPGREHDYTLNEDLATRARAWILQQKALAPDRPVFMYFAPGAAHAPLQVPKAWIEKFKGRFDTGWDEYRAQTFARQKALGVVPSDAVLTPRPADLPSWSSQSPAQKKVAARLMEVFAAFMAQTDYEIGRVIETFRQVGQLDNTLVVFIAGDNGSSLEGNLAGTDNLMEQVNGIQPTPEEILAHLDDIGGPRSTPHYPAGWAWAGNTPFQWGKRIASHLGGERAPVVVSWPKRVKDPGGLRSQYLYVTDVFPTILEAAGVPQPASVNGVAQQRVDGVSFLEVLANPAAPELRTRQHYEMHGNVAIYDRGWMASKRSGMLPWTYVVTPGSAPPAWELYDLTKDYSQATDVAAAHPQKLEELQAIFDVEAKQNQVYPIDPRVAAARDHGNAPPPGNRTFYTFYPGATQLYGANAPGTRNRTHTFTAYVDMPATGGDGVLVAEGATGAGYALYVKDRRPSYTYNYFQRQVTTVAAAEPLPAGKSVIELQFVYDGGGRGLGAAVTLTVNGKVAGQARLEKTVPAAFSFEETFDIGEDSASPVGPYRAPFRFTGTLERLELRASPPAIAPASREQAAATERARLAAIPDTRGTGAFAAMKEEVASLPDHVIYRPADLTTLGQTKLGVYLFGNGGCSNDGASSRPHLLEIASHGYLAIALGRVRSGPGASVEPTPAARPAASAAGTAPPTLPPPATEARGLTEALDWVLAQNVDRSSPFYGRIDPAAVAVSGYSCGGLQALQVATDPRIKTLVIMNSGLFNEGTSRIPGMNVPKSRLNDIHTPTLYILGGETDIAYRNGMDDFARINHVPVFVGNIVGVGHGGTYWEPNGGKAAAAVVAWLNWQLRGDTRAAAMFVGPECGLCADTSWKVEKKGVDR